MSTHALGSLNYNYVNNEIFYNYDYNAYFALYLQNQKSRPGLAYIHECSVCLLRAFL